MIPPVTHSASLYIVKAARSQGPLMSKSGYFAGITNPSSAGIDFSRQNLTSVDVRFWRLKSIPAM